MLVSVSHDYIVKFLVSHCACVPDCNLARLSRLLCTYGLSVPFLSLIIAPMVSYNLIIALLLPPS